MIRKYKKMKRSVIFDNFLYKIGNLDKNELTCVKEYGSQLIVKIEIKKDSVEFIVLCILNTKIQSVLATVKLFTLSRIPWEGFYVGESGG